MPTEIIKLEDDIIRDEEFIAIMDDDNSFMVKNTNITRKGYLSFRKSHPIELANFFSIVYLPIQILLRKVLIKL